MTLSKYQTVNLLFALLCIATVSCSTSQETQEKEVIQIIFDTDFGGDADDLGALAMLNHFQNKGEIELLAIMCWNVEKYAVSAIDAVNTYYGNPDIPIALRDAEPHETPWNYTRVLADSLTFDATPDNVPETTVFYRELLSKSEDQSVVIVTVGPLSNIMELINSKPDTHSHLNGRELIHAKVKEFVVMGGNFPISEDEWNFNGDMPGVTKYVLENIRLPITFSGAELGNAIRTGEVFKDLPKDSPLYLGFFHFGQYAPWMKHQFQGEIYDNATFDQTAVLYAIRNGLDVYWTKVMNGRCVADEHGGNIWVAEENSNHSYLVLTMPVPEIEKELENFMLGKF